MRQATREAVAGAAVKAARNHAGTRRTTRRSGLHSYAMVGSRAGNSNDVALTGGGSRGYNENLNNN